VLRSGWVSPPPVFWIFMDQGKIMEAEVPTVTNPTNGAPTPTTYQVFTGWMPFLPPNQQRQSTEGILFEVYEKTTSLIDIVCCHINEGI